MGYFGGTDKHIKTTVRNLTKCSKKRGKLTHRPRVWLVGVRFHAPLLPPPRLLVPLDLQPLQLLLEQLKIRLLLLLLLVAARPRLHLTLRTRRTQRRIQKRFTDLGRGRARRRREALARQFERRLVQGAPGVRGELFFAVDYCALDEHFGHALAGFFEGVAEVLEDFFGSLFFLLWEDENKRGLFTGKR